MVYLDLDELPSLVGRGGLIASRRFAPLAFVRGDHLFEETKTLAQELRELVEHRTGVTPRGPIRLLTQLRYCGYFMSPLNLFYVFDERDREVEFVVAEVNNTPWNERHCYVLWSENRMSTGRLHFVHRKDFHVSPFMGMDVHYRWSLGEPQSRLQVNLASCRDEHEVFVARMNLQRRELSRQQLRRMMLHYPLMSAQITGGIYYQALKLWRKQCPFYTHPKKLNDATYAERLADHLSPRIPGGRL